MPKTHGDEALSRLITAFQQFYNTDKEQQPTWDSTGALKRIFLVKTGEWIIDSDNDYTPHL